MADDGLPEPDRLEGAPHPRETARLFGHAEAEATFLSAFNSGRLHHGWLMSGPRGVGKATLAWKIARFLLATPEDDGGFFAPPPPTTLDIPFDDPVAHRLRAGADTRFRLVRRGPNDKGDKLSSVISVKDIRLLKEDLSLSAPDGGRRAVIIDAADEMNPAAANALLKLLEEPPAKVTLLLVAHQPAKLLPTIRSRCRALKLRPLSPQDLSDALTAAGTDIDPADRTALAELAGGSVGEAFRLTEQDGLQKYRALVTTLAGLPRMDRPRMLAFAETASTRAGPDGFETAVTLIDLLLSRLALTGTTGAPPPEAAPGEAALLQRLSPDVGAARGWAILAQSLSARARQGKAVNLDPAGLILDMLLKVDDTAARLAIRV
jgi:DNA polymerase-3 subunit delta'